MAWLAETIGVIKFIAKIANEYATIILVIITGVYAYFTYKMAKIMAKQVIADIQVTNVVLGSNFAENWFKERLEKQPEQISRNSGFSFNLLFDVRNQSSGSGSIDKAILVLRFTNDNFERDIPPKTKDSWNEKLEEHSGMTTYRTIVNDLGGTIFLRGGESQKIELEYMLYDPDDNLIDHIKNNLGSLEYYLKFSDNLGKNYLIRIKDIKGEREVYRK
jgi:hypothetical protein